MHHVCEVSIRAREDHVCGRVHDPGEALLDRQRGVLPGGHATLQHGNGLIAQVRQGGARERGLTPIVAGYGNGGVVGGSKGADVKLQPAARHPVGAGDVRAGKILAGIHEKNHRRQVGVQRLGRHEADLGPRRAEADRRRVFPTLLQGQTAVAPGDGAAVHHVDLRKTHLPIPGGGAGGAGCAVTGEDERTGFHHRHVVGALHGLAAGKPAEPGYVAAGVLGCRPHVDEIKGFLLPPGHHRPQSRDVQEPDAVFFGQAGRIRFRSRKPCGRRLGQFQPVGAGFQLIPGQKPSGRAVFQAVDVGQPHPLQQAGSDNAAGAPGAVHNDRGIRLQSLDDVGNAQGQFAAGNTAPAGNAKALVLFGRAGVENVQLVPPRHARLQVGRLDLRHVMHHFHLFPEILAGHVGAPLGGLVVAHPAVDAPLQDSHVAVPHAFQRGGCQRRAAPIVVAHHHTGARKRHRLRHVKFELPARQQAHPWNVRAVVFARLSDVDAGRRRIACQKVEQGCGADQVGHERRLLWLNGFIPRDTGR